jgi:type VI secretion system protein ImpG
MLNRYFQQELNHLKDLGAEFSSMHPAVASMLSGSSTDPDVERLLEGVAFLTGLLRQKLDDDFPEVIHALFQLIWPHYLRPLPSVSIVVFTPKSNLKQMVTIPKGVQLSSVPVDGTPCLFRTCYDVDVHPLFLADARFDQQPGRPPAIRLMFELQDINLSDWRPESLRLYLAGPASEAADLYLVLRRHLKQMVITPTGQAESCILPPGALETVGFGSDDDLIPYPSNSFPGYRNIQEYFILPEKFLFLDIKGWSGWKNRGAGKRFEVAFQLDRGSIPSLRVGRQSFALGATPVINLFEHDADPIRLDHRRTAYPIRPTGSTGDNYQVYDVKKVSGYIQGAAREKTYAPFERFAPNMDAQPTYHTTRQSPLHDRFDFYLSVAYAPGEAAPPPETLSLKLVCSNGPLPEGLQTGDIRFPTSSTPEFVDFKNIRPPTASIHPALGGNLLWVLVSHLNLNFQSLTTAEHLKAILNLYNFDEHRDRVAYIANQKRVAGIDKVAANAADLLVDGVIMRGRDIRLDMRQDHFSGEGDLFLFGMLLDHFLGSFASMNTFTRLTIKEILKGEVYQWPARIGDHPLT